MRMAMIARLTVIAVFLFAIGRASLSQTTTARLQGTITDPSGAVVVGATVAATDLATGLVTTVKTNDAGLYTIPALARGNYRVEVTQQGFATTVKTLTLQVMQVAVVDFQLQIGQTSQSVTVSGGAPLVDAADSTISQVIVGPQITDLPLNGGNFTQLATLMPGVTRGVPTGQATGSQNNAETFRYGQEGGASLAVNGLPPQANNFVLDGIDNNESLVNTIVFFPPFDAINEFRIDTNVAPAEYGRAGGGIEVTSLKSGTNSFHGDAYWFHRDQTLDARPFFSRSELPFARNFFGGSVGGPILKNKLFFFGDFRALRLNQPSESNVGTVPTDLMRQGDFSELLCGGAPTCPASTDLGTPVQIIDPTSGLQFMGNGTQPNVIPTNRVNSVGQNYLKAFPEPNCNPSTDSRCGTIINNYVNSRTLIENWNDFDVRVDYNLNSSNQFFGRFSRDRTDQTSTTFLSTLPSGFGSGTNFNHPYGSSLGWTHIFNANVISEMHLGFVRTSYGYNPPDEGTPLCTQLGIVNCNTSPLLGGIALIGGYNTQIEYTGDYGPYLVPQTGYEWNDTITWVHGKHNVKFGANIIRRQLNLFRPLAGKGYFFLFGNGGGQSPTHYEVSDLLAGFVNSYSVGPPYGMVGTRSWENGFFTQDDWTVSPRLTLNLGLRYDVLTWPTEVFDRQANFDLVTGQLIVAGSNGASRTLIPNDYLNFAPRLGFAYQLTGDGKTVLRGGFGLFYFIERGGISNQLAQNPPFSGEATFTYAQGYRITLSGQTGSPTDNNSIDATKSLPLGFLTNLNLASPTGVSVLAEPATNTTPRVAEWNLQLQRQLNNNTAVSVGYVGDHGARLMTNYNANFQPFGVAPGTGLAHPQLGTVSVLATAGYSNYDSLQIQINRRMTSGLQFLGSFTWQKDLDGPCSEVMDCGSPLDPNNLSLDYGPALIDQPYVLSLSGLYQLPFGRGQRWGSNWGLPLDEALGGWHVNSIYTLQGGLPFDISVGGCSNSYQRPDAAGGFHVHPGNLNGYIDPSSFTLPAATVYGSAGSFACTYNAPGNVSRDILLGPGLSNMDLAIFKDFVATERAKVQFRVQFYNLTNTPHFGQPNSFFGNWNVNSSGQLVASPNPTFGQITGTLPYTNRQIELGLRVIF